MKNSNTPYILGIDVGTSSIGWAAVSLEAEKPAGILKMGVRRFEAGVDGTIEKGLGPELGPLPSLDDVIVSVSAQWDELSDAEKVVIGLILNRETVEQGTTPASAVSPNV